MTVLSILIILSGCSRKQQKLERIDIYDFFASGDSVSLLEYIEENQTDVRRQINNKLKSYIKIKSKDDFMAIGRLSEELNWCLSYYTDKTKNRDLENRWELYQRWGVSEAAQKLRLDSLLNYTQKNKELLGMPYPERMSVMQTEYGALGDSFMLASINSFLANHYYEREIIDSSLAALSRCLSLSKALDLFELIGDCELLRAKVRNLYNADYAGAERSYISATRAYKKTNNDYRNLFALIGRGALLVQLNQSDHAIKLLRSALNGFDQYKKPMRAANCRYYLAEVFYNKGDLDSALYYIGRSIDYHKEKALVSKYGLIELGYGFSCRGLIYHAQRKYRLSMADYKTADSLFLAADEKAGYCLNAFRTATLLLDEGNYKEADSLYRSVLKRSDRFEETLFSLYGLGICDYAANDFPSALRKLRTCVKLVETAKRTIPIPEITSGLMSDKVGFYHLLSTIFIHQYKITTERGYLDSALLYLERSKTSAMINEITSEKNRRTSDEERKIMYEISQLQKNLALRQGDPVLLEKKIDKYEDSLRFYRLEVAEPLAVSHDRQISIPTAQDKLLRNDDILLEYMLSEFGSFVFIMNKTEIEVVEIEITLSELEHTIGAFLTTIMEYPDKQDLLRKTIPYAADLYSILIPEKIKSFSSPLRLIIIPSGILHYVPFESLIDSQVTFLVEKHACIYGPSLNILYMLHSRQNEIENNKRLVAFGAPVLPKPAASDLNESTEYDDTYLYDVASLPDLPYARQEINLIAELYKEEIVDIRLREKAQECLFLTTDYTDVRYIHLATHGIVNDHIPSRSAIVFSFDADSRSDGLLQPDEIMALDLNADLAFLSACRSGSGTYYPGEGVMSLARPFLIAGCDAAIASLWNVNDRSTTTLVGDFYKYLRQGKSKSKALAQAKRRMLSSDRELYHHPYFWAPFVMTGID